MSNKRIVFEGSATAVATPFRNGAVDYEALGRMIDFQIEGGIKALLFCGTTGESSTMPDEEHMAVIRFGIEKTNGRVPVIANTGSNDTAHAIELSRLAEKAGADALLSVAPYYNKSTQRGLVAHFTAISKSVGLPIILYNVPARTVVNIDAPTIIELSGLPNIVGVKECNIFQTAEVILNTPGDFSVYSGCDDEVLQFMSLGARGLISVMSNIIPDRTQRITESYLTGRTSSAMNEFYSIYPLIKALGLETNPIPIKKALMFMGMATGDVRLPLVEMSGEHSEKLHFEMKNLGLV
ncbi:MAG: 4-hydroxy-tetrahydrodipicolinate synthase [Clostridia bacterium]|nr:4-hydroxy-tetrahydrodipicolinate synthase [Clostridia bacterium]